MFRNTSRTSTKTTSVQVVLFGGVLTSAAQASTSKSLALTNASLASTSAALSSTSDAPDKQKNKQTTTRSSSAIINRGLIDYWPFNGNMFDSVTGLTMSGSFGYVTDRRGRANSAINFNGGFAYIPKCGNIKKIASIALWINFYDVTDSQNVITLNNDYYTLSIVNDRIRFWANGEVFVTSSYGINQWTHVTTTLDGSMSYLYVNGDVAWSGPHGNVIPMGSSNTCSFGWYGYDWNLKAYLDDVFFYNRALTAPEVIIVMQSGL